jgi:hypothetical protein
MAKNPEKNEQIERVPDSIPAAAQFTAKRLDSARIPVSPTQRLRASEPKVL